MSNKHSGIELEVLYLDAQSTTLLKRFHITRRKHPLSNDSRSLSEAMKPKSLLEPLATVADLKLDTTDLGMYQLRDMIKGGVAGHRFQELAILIQSFGFKMAFSTMRTLSSMSVAYPTLSHFGNTTVCRPGKIFGKTPESGRMIEDIGDFIPAAGCLRQASNRTYMTIGVAARAANTALCTSVSSLGCAFVSGMKMYRPA